MQLPLHVKKINYLENNLDKNKKKDRLSVKCIQKKKRKIPLLFLYINIIGELNSTKVHRLLRPVLRGRR